MKLEYVGICGSDLHDYEKGTIDDFVVEPPFVLGHEPDGAIVLVGYSRTGEMTLPTDDILNKELTLKSIFRYRHIYPTAIEVVASGKINLKGIVSDIFPCPTSSTPWMRVCATRQILSRLSSK